MKTFDGREKSLLRAATRDVPPDPVADRVRSPYPSPQANDCSDSSARATDRPWARLPGPVPRPAGPGTSRRGRRS